MSALKRASFKLRLRDASLTLGLQTRIMGVLNVTPDSFSDGGCFADPGAAEAQALAMERQGADLIDVGGESSRPGAAPLSAREEIKRIRPVLKRLARSVRVPVSVDTYKEETARVALDEGAVLVNDIRALRGGRCMAKRIARYRAGVVLMHMRGTPRTMQLNTRYPNFLENIMTYLRKAVDRALEAGISRSSVVIDPGFGFGKSVSQNFMLLKELGRFRRLKLPILAGVSRKSFLGHAQGLPVSDRLYVSLGAAAAAIAQGVHILRVHDVLPHRQLAEGMDASLKRG